MHFLLLGSGEIANRSLWYPSILGVLVVVAAIVLFVGSVYLLLATSLGARLGFLVAAASLSGFMVVLSLLWWTTQSPLNTFKGRLPKWEPIAVLDRLSDSKIDDVATIEEKGTKVDVTEAANIKAAVDETLVLKEAEHGVSPSPFAEGKGFTYTDPTMYLVPETYQVGGRDTDGISNVMTRFFHPPLYSVARFCTATDVSMDATGVPFGLPPGAYDYDAKTGKYKVKAAECERGTTKYLVLERDLGSLRVPPMMTFIISSLLFALSLLGLHWRERDEQQRAAMASGARPVPAGA